MLKSDVFGILENLRFSKELQRRWFRIRVISNPNPKEGWDVIISSLFKYKVNLGLQDFMIFNTKVLKIYDFGILEDSSGIEKNHYHVG